MASQQQHEPIFVTCGGPLGRVESSRKQLRQYVMRHNAKRKFFANDGPSGSTKDQSTCLYQTYAPRYNRATNVSESGGWIDDIVDSRTKSPAISEAGHKSRTETAGQSTVVCGQPSCSDLSAFQASMNSRVALSCSEVPCSLSPFAAPLGWHNDSVSEIAKWYFCSPGSYFPRSAYSCWTVRHFIAELWNVACSNDVLFTGITALALQKKAEVMADSEETRIAQQKGSLIRKLQDSLDSQGADAEFQIILAIAMLAYLDTRDGDYKSALVHLQGLRLFPAVSSLSGAGWFFVAWLNIHLALHLREEPILPLQVPSSLLTHAVWNEDVRNRIEQQALADADRSPESLMASHAQMHELFRKLRYLLLQSDGEQSRHRPPVTQSYELEYELRLVHAGIHKCRTDAHLHRALELVVITIQFHLWIASRSWQPLRVDSFQVIIDQATALLADSDDIVHTWTRYADMSTLLWVLSVLVATIFDHQPSSAHRPVRILSDVLQAMDLNTFDQYHQEVSQWPWIEDWHRTRYGRVWFEVSVRSAIPQTHLRLTPTT